MPDAFPRAAYAGDRDVAAAAAVIASRLPDGLRELAAIAFDYRWSWTRDGAATFAAIDAERFARVHQNPVRLLRETPGTTLEAVARDPAMRARVRALAEEVRRERAEDDARDGSRPVAFFCAEFGVHTSLPVYSGGLGVLAGDILKEASDRGLPMVGVGLLYRHGYFHQRLDPHGKQHEYWTDVDPEQLPTVLVTGDDGEPLTVDVRIRGEDVVARIWRTDVGRVPLYLLDADEPRNSPLSRWITARLYEGNRDIRLAQYALLGVGGMRALRRLGIDPAIVHLNEGHPALATLELAHELAGDGRPFDDALVAARSRVVFTTHTPVPAGNETYDEVELARVVGELADELGCGRDGLVRLARVEPGDGERPGMTPLAIRTSRSTNGVSAVHGRVAREMWRPMFTGTDATDVPITHVTNGVHLPTWMAAPMQSLLARHLGRDWIEHPSEPQVWAGVDDIPDDELWAVRDELRGRLVGTVRDRSTRDRLARGESLDYVAAAASTFEPGRLTVGFARRLATYKRLHLLSLEPARAVALVRDHVQFVFAGKAHPLDEDAKRVAEELFELKDEVGIGGRVAFLEDYGMDVAAPLVAGCDVWLNVPRPPFEASGTSGMKAALNGGLNVSVLDGWWAEAYDPAAGWAVDGDRDERDDELDDAACDRRDARSLLDILEREVVPLFARRDGDGIPHAWLARVKASLRTIGPRFCATRMLEDYERAVYGVASLAPS